jgi:hypothetical protein
MRLYNHTETSELSHRLCIPESVLIRVEDHYQEVDVQVQNWKSRLNRYTTLFWKYYHHSLGELTSSIRGPLPKPNLKFFILLIKK